MTEEDLNLAEWGAEFEYGEEASWGSDDDGTSHEGSISEDSAYQDSGLHRVQSHSAFAKDSSPQEDGDLDIRTKTTSNRYARDPSADAYGDLGHIIKEYCSSSVEDESVLNSMAGDHMLCSNSDLFKMIVEMLFGSPSELFSSKVEHVLVSGGLKSFVKVLETGESLFHTTHVLDRVRAPLLGGTCSKQLCVWFTDIASKSALCKYFASLGNQELYSGLLGVEAEVTPHDDQLSALLNCVKGALCNIVERYEADIVKLESEHNKLVHAFKRGSGRGEREESVGGSDSDVALAYAQAAKALSHTSRGSSLLLGRPSCSTNSQSLLSLYSMCSAWVPVLGACTELIRSMLVLTQHARGPQASVYSLGLVHAIDQIVRCYHMELCLPYSSTSKSVHASATASQRDSLTDVSQHIERKRDAEQLRLQNSREWRKSLDPHVWFHLLMQEEIFPASLAYLVHVGHAERVVCEDSPAHVAKSAGSLAGPPAVVGLLTSRAEELGLQYPHGQTFQIEQERELAGPFLMQGCARFFQRMHTLMDVCEQKEWANLKEMLHSRWVSDKRTQPKAQWHLEHVAALHGDNDNLDHEKPSYRLTRSASWKAAVAKFQSDKSKINDDKVRVEPQERKNSQRLPLSSLLEITVLRRFARKERTAELRYMHELWCDNNIATHFEKMQVIFLMGGDEQLYGAVKGIVDAAFDVTSTAAPGGLDQRTLVRRQLALPYALKTMKACLPRVLEDRIREVVANETISFSVTMDTAAMEDEQARDGGGGALSLMHMVSCLSVQATASHPVSLLFSHSVCDGYDSVLSYLLHISVCRWVCERVRVGSRASLLAYRTGLRSGMTSAQTSSAAFKRDCYATITTLLHVIGAVTSCVQAQAHRLLTARHYVDKDTDQVDMSLVEVQRIHMRMMTELVRILAALQPALLPLLRTACGFAERYVALLRLEAQFEGEAAFELSAAPCKKLQVALLRTKDAMHDFVVALHRLVTESSMRVDSSPADSADVSALKQLEIKLRALLKM